MRSLDAQQRRHPASDNLGYAVARHHQGTTCISTWTLVHLPSRYGTKNPAGTVHRTCRRHRFHPPLWHRGGRRLLVAALAFAPSAIAEALAGCHPTGTPIVDPLETPPSWRRRVTVIVSRSSRGTWLVVGVGVVLLFRGWLLLPAVATIGLGFTSVFPWRSHRRLGALVGALGFQVMLRWPPELFHGFPTLVAAALLLLCVVSAYRRSGSRIQRRVRLDFGRPGRGRGRPLSALRHRRVT